VCLINVDGYFDGLVAQLAAAKKHALLYTEPAALIGVETTAAKALAHCLHLVKPKPAEKEVRSDIGEGDEPDRRVAA